jgi:putative transposase
MPRKKREWFEGATYHLTARGNRKEDIFREKRDYEHYISCIKEALKYYEERYRIICYCLMTNHVHIQMETSDMHISNFMKRVNGLYAQYFNRKYDFVGHLFQGRYGAELIKTDQYSLEASRYIHLNPVRAGMVIKPEEYQWSSYGMYIGVNPEGIIDTDAVLSYFQKENKRQLYKEYVENAI